MNAIQQAARKCRSMDVTLGAIPLVARIIAQAEGVQVVFRGHQAKTDGSTIVLPSMPSLAEKAGTDIRRIKTLLWGYLDHEAAHVLETDFGALEVLRTPSLVPGDKADFERLCALTNVVEDIRIEAKMGARFPGAALNLRDLVQLLVDDGTFVAANEKHTLYQRVASFVLHEGRASTLGQRALMSLAAKDREVLPEEVVKELEPLMDMSSVVTTADAARRAREILDLVARHEPPSTGDKGDSPTNGGDQHSNSPDDTNDASDNDDASITPDASADDAPAFDQVLAQGGDLGNVLQDALKGDPDSVDDASAFEQETRDSTMRTSPERRSLQDPSAMRRAGHEIRHGIQRTLEANTLALTRLSRRGRMLDQRVLHRAGMGDGRLFRKRSQRRAVDTAVVIALDLSPSMSSRWECAVEAACAITNAMSAIQRVKVGLYVFPVMRWASPIGAVTPAVRIGNLWAVSGTTPTAQALVDGGLALLSCRQTRKVLCCVTDGDPDAPVDREIDILRSVGIQTLGIGINTNSRQAFDQWVEIKEVRELKSVLASAMNALTNE